MASKVEQVAKVCCMHQDCRAVAIMDGEFDGTCPHPDECNWRSYEDEARAAIEAMRIPEVTPEPLTYDSLLRKQNYQQLARKFNLVIDAILSGDFDAALAEEEDSQ